MPEHEEQYSLAEFLATTGKKKAWFRASMNRSYYAVLHHAIQFLSETGTHITEIYNCSHEIIWKKIRAKSEQGRAIANAAHYLKTRRK